MAKYSHSKYLTAVLEGIIFYMTVLLESIDFFVEGVGQFSPNIEPHPAFIVAS